MIASPGKVELGSTFRFTTKSKFTEIYRNLAEICLAGWIYQLTVCPRFTFRFSTKRTFTESSEISTEIHLRVPKSEPKEPFAFWQPRQHAPSDHFQCSDQPWVSLNGLLGLVNKCKADQVPVCVRILVFFFEFTLTWRVIYFEDTLCPMPMPFASIRASPRSNR